MAGYHTSAAVVHFQRLTVTPERYIMFLHRPLRPRFLHRSGPAKLFLLCYGLPLFSRFLSPFQDILWKR